MNASALRVIIAGGGVAALEGALALRELAGESVQTTLIAPEPEFVYRPMRVCEPFGESLVRHYDVRTIAEDLGAELVRGRCDWLDTGKRTVHVTGGRQLTYDVLLLAVGGRLYTRFKHTLTVDDRVLDDQLHGLIQDIEQGYVRRVAFIAPSPMPWPLPIYELALMTARRAYDMNVELHVAIATPEDAPLAVIGQKASDSVGRLLSEHGIEIIASAYCEVPEPGRVSIHPHDRTLLADRIVALPQLVGPALRGLAGTHDGFIPIDSHCKVRGVERVFAAGDATDFAVKHGGVAAQQADVAAEAIAALAGAPIEPRQLCPEIQAILLGGPRPLYLSARITGGHGSRSEVSELASSPPLTKIAARYLGPSLQALDTPASAVH